MTGKFKAWARERAGMLLLISSGAVLVMGTVSLTTAAVKPPEPTGPATGDLQSVLEYEQYQQAVQELEASTATLNSQLGHASPERVAKDAGIGLQLVDSWVAEQDQILGFGPSEGTTTPTYDYRLGDVDIDLISVASLEYRYFAVAELDSSADQADKRLSFIYSTNADGKVLEFSAWEAPANT